MIKIIIASFVESLIPLIFGIILSRKLFKEKSRKIFYLGPFLLMYAALLFLKPFLHEPSQSFLYQFTYSHLLTYDDFVGEWHQEVKNDSYNKKLIYNFTIKANGDCSLDYNSKDLTLNEDSKYFYAMKCSYENEKFVHVAKDSNTPEKFDASYRILKVTNDVLIGVDQNNLRHQYSRIK